MCNNNDSFFNSRGMIESSKNEEELLFDESLKHNKQKFERFMHDLLLDESQVTPELNR